MQNMVPGSTKRIEEVFTASENDVLRDTDLRQAPGRGAIGFWAASDVADSTISIRIGGISLINAQVVPDRGTDSPINENDQAPTAMTPTVGGELIQVDVVEVTAMSMRLVAIFIGA
ncbi:hypothetical protein LCGC14_2486940 [marine sediment metagenome]|uniref:Uncharacterized protein n=1 Tax=marine sediment metagenome TaxID=412755 RepID=A0A0F9DHU6_9ZZZZ